MAINVIDPNEILFGNSGLNYANYENFIPEYQNMIPYVEFFSIKRDSIVNYLNNNNELIISEFNKVNLLGFDDDAYGNKEKLFTAKYLDNDPSGEKPIKESFGIKSIDIKTNASYVPTVEINFVDVRGQSYFAKSQGSKSKYGVLLDFPPPLFVLRMKGVYGMLVEYRLHLTKTNVKLNSSNGNYEIKANFIGYNIAPLTDINLGILNSVHFLKGYSTTSIDFREEPRSIYELIYVGKVLITKLDLYKKSDKYQEFKQKEQDLESLKQEKKDILDKLRNEDLIFNGDNSDTDIVKIDTDPKDNTITLVIDNTNSSIEDNVYNILKNAIEKYYKDTIKILIDENTISANDILINKEDSPNKFTFVVYPKNYITNYNKKEAVLKKQINSISLEIQKNASDILNLKIWKPTIKNITEIITRDIDYFFQELYKAANTKKDTIQGLTAYNSNFLNTVTNIQFPDYLKEQTINGVKQTVKLYPGENPNYVNWGEVQLVERIIKGIITSKSTLIKLDELIADIEGDSKWIPIIPYENKSVEQILTNEYFGNNTIENIFSIVLKRFYIAKNYSYKGFFDEDGKDLIKMVAQFEARNLLFAINNEPKLLQLLKRFSQEYTNQNDINLFLNKIPDDYKFRKILGSFEFRDGITDTKISARSSPVYSGLRIIKSQSVSDKPNTISDNEVDNLIDNIDDLLLSIFDFQEKILLSNSNTIVFIDTEKNEDKKIDSNYDNYISDFITLSDPDAPGLIFSLERKIDKYIQKRAQEKTYTNTLNDFLLYCYDTEYFVDPINDDNDDAAEIYFYKFVFSGLIEMPVIYLLFLGWLIKNKKTNYKTINVLTENDKKIISNYFDEYININETIYGTIDFINQYNKRITNINERHNLIKENIIAKHNLMGRIYLMNNSPLTFTTKIDTGIYETLNSFLFDNNSKQLTSNAFEPLDINNTYEKKYFTEFFTEIKNKINDVINQLKEKESNTLTDLFGDNDVKTQLYYGLKNLFDRWLASSNDSSENLYKTIFDENITKSFKFVDRAMNTIAEDVIMDYSELIQDATDYSLSAYTVLTRFYSKNNFLFFPLQSSLIFTGDNTLDKDKFKNFFKLNYQINEEATSKSAFVCMFINSFSSNLNIDSDFFPDDALSFLNSKLPDDFNDKSNAYVFIVSFGKQNQSIFNNIEISTAEFNDTFESLKIVDMLTSKNGDSNAVMKSQNLYDVIRQRSYSATIQIPLGNMCIQPTMYFELVGTPIFNGGYLITDVEHNIESSTNKIVTKFRGTRVGKFSLPMIIDPLVNVKNYLNIQTEEDTPSNNLISIPNNKNLQDNLNELNSENRLRFKQLIDKWEEAGWSTLITDATRNDDSDIGAEFSSHKIGLAIDVNLTNKKTGKKLIMGKGDNKIKQEWIDSGVVKIATDLNFRWGGEFKYKNKWDVVHFDLSNEYDVKKTIQNAQKQGIALNKTVLITKS
jgi:hypothetical protein